MALPIATAFVDIRPYTKSFSRDLKAQLDAESAAAAGSGARAGESFAAGMASKVTKIARGITFGLAAAGGVMAVAGIDLATKFNSDMELLVTQAGVSQKALGALSAGVLKLSGQVGFGPDSLSEALFHVESNFSSLGIKAPEALHLVKIAAEGAATGHADLVDVTNALTAAVAAGIPGVSNFSKAMGILNATVGAGDMTMQNLSEAFGTGVIASVKQFGLSIYDVGAALDVFGDNNIRGAKAGTQLRMAVQALAAPTSAGAKLLQSFGITSGNLAGALQKGGLKLALEELVSHLTKAGVTGKQMGAVITEAFGKKAGVGLSILTDQMQRFESKYPALDKGATGFGAAWSHTQKTLAQRLNDMKAGFEALEVRIGEKLIPVVQKLFTWVSGHLGLVKNLALSIAGVAVAITAVSYTVKAITAVTTAFRFLQAQALGTRIELMALAAWEKISAAALWLMNDACIGTRLGLLALEVQTVAVGVASKIAAAGQWLLNVALDANPIGIVVIAVAALAGGLYELYQHVGWFRTAVQDTWGWIKDHWKELAVIILGPFGLAIDIIVTQWKHVVAGAQDVYDWFADRWKDITSLVSGPARQAVANLGEQLHIAEDLFADLYRYVWSDFGAKIYDFLCKTLPHWQDMAVTFIADRLVGGFEQQFGDLYQWIWSDFGQKIYTFLTKTIPLWFGDAVSGVQSVWQQLETAVKVPVNWLIQYAYDDGIRKVWDFVANLAGLPGLPLIATLAGGGRIPGFGGGDRYPALLEGGEAVIDKHRTAALAPLLAAVGVPGFSQGGLIGDKGNTGTSQASLLGSLLGGIGDTAKIMAALATGNKTALANAMDALLPSGTGGAKAGSGIAGLMTALPKAIIGDLVAKVVKAFAGSGNAIVQYAESFIGKVPYVWGGTTTAGWDCSGFTDFVYRHFGYDSIPRTAAQQQAWAQKTGSPVPGGLAFFAGADGTAASAGHVGIVTGPNQMVDAFGTGFGTRLNTLFGSSGAVGGFGVPPGGFGARKFDSGGWLPPGITLALNGTGRPERVLGPGASGGGMETVEALLRQLIAVLSGVPDRTGGSVAASLNGVTRRAGYRQMYSAR